MRRDDTEVVRGPRGMRVLRPLGEGGMGEVVLAARNEGRFERTYAIKRLRAAVRELPEVRRAFLDEARLSALLYHPNVVRVYDVGEDEHGPFLVMEFVEAIGLHALIATARAQGWDVPLSVAVAIARDAALGLRAAHEARDASGRPMPIVHRDVSPPNVLIGLDGVARLADFGIARTLGATSAATRAILQGKRSYQAPEILRFEPPEQPSDVFALGVVLFELLTLDGLYHGGDAERRILHEPPPDLLDHRPDAPDELVALVIELLAKEPTKRPTARALVRRLEAIAAPIELEQEQPSIRAFVAALRALTRAPR